jgi:phosphonopyruvate decarboxylase
VAGAGAVIGCCDFVTALGARGWGDAAGVPCSTFDGPIAHLGDAGRYEASANEGTALASAVGAALAGQRRVVLLQNSGLGNLINPLASLAIPYAVPVLAFMSLRGWPDPTADEPQHEEMGRSGAQVLTTLGVWHSVLNGDDADLQSVLDRAEREIARGRPAFVLVPRGKLGRHPGSVPALGSPELPRSADVVAAVSRWVRQDDLVISTTGYISRELFAAAHRPRNFYMQGSMGHAAAIALGYCTARPDADVVVLDGDGALLMHLGVLSTIGAAAPRGLTHVVVDNGGYASTGGQPASTQRTDLASVALACGYRTAVTVGSDSGLPRVLQALRGLDGPHCVVVRARSGVDAPPPRPSTALRLTEVATRIMDSGLPVGSRP